MLLCVLIITNAASAVTLHPCTHKIHLHCWNAQLVHGDRKCRSCNSPVTLVNGTPLPPAAFDPNPPSLVAIPLRSIEELPSPEQLVSATQGCMRSVPKGAEESFSQISLIYLKRLNHAISCLDEDSITCCLVDFLQIIPQVLFKPRRGGKKNKSRTSNRLKNALKNLRQGKAAFFKNYQREPRPRSQLNSENKQISIQISRAKRLAALGHISRATQSLKPDKIVDASLPARQEQFRNLCPTQNAELPALPREAPSILLQDLEGPQDSFFKIFKKDRQWSSSRYRWVEC